MHTGLSLAGFARLTGVQEYRVPGPRNAPVMVGEDLLTISTPSPAAGTSGRRRRRPCRRDADSCARRRRANAFSGTRTWATQLAPSGPQAASNAAGARLLVQDAGGFEQIDRHAVAGPAMAVAAIVGADHPHAGLVEGPRGCVRGRRPGPVAEAQAFADGAAGAGDGEPLGVGSVALVGEVAGQRHGQRQPVRPGQQLLPCPEAE